MMKIGRHFYGAYIRALLAASLAFGTAHGTQLFVVSAVESSNNLHVNPTAIFILPIFELPQSIVFFFVGAIFAYVPSIIAIGMLKQGKSNRVVGYVLCGTFIGLIFLPLCAGVAFVTFHDRDSPTYLARCGEFGLAMVIAGATGGYAFWRRARVIDGDVEAMADHFS